MPPPPRATTPPASSVAPNPADTCTERRARARDLSNEGDQHVKIDVDGAIARYTQATEIFPQEHRIFWKLAAAHEKKDEWAGMATALEHAVELAPQFANYWYKLGLARVNLGDDGEPEFYERAKEPLRRCIATDQNLAECHYLLGRALESTGDARAALAAFSEAIRRDPTRGVFYPALGELYLTLGLIQQAGDVLHEGLRLTPPYAKNHVSLFAMHTLLASIAGAKHDEADRLRWLQQSEPYLGVDHPEEAFGLGAAYAGTTPPQNERASRLLRGFIKQTCGAGAAPIDELECETARQLVARLRAP